MSTTARKSAVTVAALLAGALLMSGCSSEGDKSGAAGGGDKGNDGAKPGNSAPAEEPSDDAGDGGDGGSTGGSDGGGSGDEGGGKGGKTAGVWKLEGQQVVLTIVADTVTLLREEGRNCTGPLGPDGKTFALKCKGGGDESRTAGSLGPVRGKSIEVAWKTGKTETYKRVTDVPVEIPENQ